MRNINTNLQEEFRREHRLPARQEVRESSTRFKSHFEKWELDSLIDYVLNTHHYFTWINLPVIKEHALKVARGQGADYPETIEVNRLFKELASDLEAHLENQEHELFPYIRQLVFAKRDKRSITCGNLPCSVLGYKAEHQCFTTKIKQIISILNQSEIADRGEPTSTKLLDKLFAFQHDLRQHKKLEEGVIFPKAISLENQLSGN